MRRRRGIGYTGGSPRRDFDFETCPSKRACWIKTHCRTARRLVGQWVNSVGATKEEKGNPVTETNPDGTPGQRARFARVRLLNEEVDRLTLDLEQHAAGVANKASFLAVSAGVLIAASVGQVWTVFPAGGLLTLALACVGLLSAAVALRPAKRVGLIAQRLADRYLDTSMASMEIEAILVREKADNISTREVELVGRARWVWGGFGALVVSAATLSVAFGMQLFGGK